MLIVQRIQKAVLGFRRAAFCTAGAFSRAILDLESIVGQWSVDNDLLLRCCCCSRSGGPYLNVPSEYLPSNSSFPPSPTNQRFFGNLAMMHVMLKPYLCVVMLLLGLGLGSHPAQAWWMWTPGDTVDDVGYRPTQPIPYSHKLHAGDLKIPCQYCHAAARRSTSAGIPPLNTCMGCHKVVRTDREAIKNITAHYKSNKPMEWIKVHDLPDFVKFSHKPHVLAGLECQSCHGPVQEMEVVEQVAPLQMGWCIGCHKDKGAPITCNTCHY